MNGQARFNLAGAISSNGSCNSDFTYYLLSIPGHNVQFRTVAENECIFAHIKMNLLFKYLIGALQTS